SSERAACHSFSGGVTTIRSNADGGDNQNDWSAELNRLRELSRSIPNSSWARASFCVTSIPSTLATLDSCESRATRSSIHEMGPSVNNGMAFMLFPSWRLLTSPIRNWGQPSREPLRPPPLDRLELWQPSALHGKLSLRQHSRAARRPP